MGCSRETLARKGRNGLASHALFATAPAPYSTGDPRERPLAECVAAEGGGPAAPRGTRQARSATERREEPDRGPDEGRGVRVLGFHHPPRAVSAGQVVGAAAVGREAADGIAAEAQGGVPALGLPADGPGDRRDQPGAARLGELFPSWALV